MTDPSSPADPGPVDPDVELASAHLDGEAGPDEGARVEDPVVASHLAAFRRVADQTRDVPSPPEGLVDDHVARAMAAFDGEGRVVSIGRAGGPTSWWQRIPLGAVAAALVVVALIGAASLGSFGGDDDDTATSALDTADDSDDSRDGDDSGGETGSAGATQESTGDAAEESTTLEADAGLAPERVSYVDYDGLAAGLRAELAGPAATTEPASDDEDLAERTERNAGSGEGAGTDPCGAVPLLGLDPASVVLVRPAVVGSDEVTSVVHDAEDGRRLTVVDDATCTVVLDRLL